MINDRYPEGDCNHRPASFYLERASVFGCFILDALNCVDSESSETFRS
jgi:hypothetical protein